MPAYGTCPYSKSAYPGQNVLLVGYRAIPDGPTAERVEQLETITSGYKSIPVCIAPAAGVGVGYSQRQITWQCTYGAVPQAIGWTLEGSINDIEDEYQPVDTSTNVGIFQQTVASNLRFFRVHCTSLTGSATASVKVTGL